MAPIKHWSAILPTPDEGTAAHLWQLLMAAELPTIAFFAFTWLPRAARQALLILAIQAAAVSANLVSLYVLER